MSCDYIFVGRLMGAILKINQLKFHVISLKAFSKIPTNKKLFFPTHFKGIFKMGISQSSFPIENYGWELPGVKSCSDVPLRNNSTSFIMLFEFISHNRSYWGQFVLIEKPAIIRKIQFCQSIRVHWDRVELILMNFINAEIVFLLQ